MTSVALYRAALRRRFERVMRAQFLVKELRREIGPIRPHNGFQLVVYRELRENGQFLQRLENVPPQLTAKISLSLDAVREFQPNPVVAPALSFSDFRYHWITPVGQFVSALCVRVPATNLRTTLPYEVRATLALSLLRGEAAGPR